MHGPGNTHTERGLRPDMTPSDTGTNLSRRAFLCAAAVSLLAMAGCSYEGDEAPEEPEPTEGELGDAPGEPTPEPEPEPAPAPVPTTLPVWVDPQTSEILLAAVDDPEVAQIVTNAEAMGQADQKLAAKLLKLAADSPSSRHYVAMFPSLYPGEPAGGLNEGDLGNGGIPLLMQWDQRWGYTEFLGGPFGTKGCGPTCLSMLYTGLTRQTDLSPYDVGQMVVETGLGDPEGGTYSDFIAVFCEKVGFVCEDVPTLSQAADYLDAGNILVCNLETGTFTEVGHYVLVTGRVGEYVRVRDPYNTLLNDSTWPLYVITDECKGIAAIRKP